MAKKKFDVFIFGVILLVICGFLIVGLTVYNLQDFTYARNRCLVAGYDTVYQTGFGRDNVECHNFTMEQRVARGLMPDG